MYIRVEKWYLDSLFKHSIHELQNLRKDLLRRWINFIGMRLRRCERRRFTDEAAFRRCFSEWTKRKFVSRRRSIFSQEAQIKSQICLRNWNSASLQRFCLFFSFFLWEFDSSNVSHWWKTTAKIKVIVMGIIKKWRKNYEIWNLSDSLMIRISRIIRKLFVCLENLVVYIWNLSKIIF